MQVSALAGEGLVWKRGPAAGSETWPGSEDLQLVRPGSEDLHLVRKIAGVLLLVLLHIIIKTTITLLKPVMVRSIHAPVRCKMQTEHACIIITLRKPFQLLGIETQSIKFFYLQYTVSILLLVTWVRRFTDTFIFLWILVPCVNSAHQVLLRLTDHLPACCFKFTTWVPLANTLACICTCILTRASW